MDLSGRADPKTDMEGLRQAWIESKIRAAKAAAVAPRGKKPNPAGVDVSPAERSSTWKRSTAIPTSRTSPGT